MNQLKWHKTGTKGIRYRQHPTRKHGKKFDVYYAIRYQENGIRIEEGLGWASETGITLDKAIAELSKLREAAVKGEGPVRLAEKREIEDSRKAAGEAEQERLEKDAVTFDAFFTDTYLPLAKSSKKESSTNREEGLYSVWIKPVIGHLPLKDVAPFTLEKLKQIMAGKKQAPRSIEYALAVIRQVFNTAKRSGAYLGESPTANVKRPKVDNGRMRFLTRAEADAILAALKDRSQDVHDMTLLSLHAGLRFSEIASLTWQDVDLSKGTLTIRDAKAGSRYAFLTEQAADMLRSRDKREPADYVFQKRGEEEKKKEKMTRISHTFFRVVDDLKLNEGIDDPRLQICFHSCRHSYASWMIEQGADLYTVQKLLGHKTNVMTQRYAHLSENRLRDAARALGTAWKGQTEQEQAGQVVNFQK
jgi:integrase